MRYTYYIKKLICVVQWHNIFRSSTAIIVDTFTVNNYWMPVQWYNNKKYRRWSYFKLFVGNSNKTVAIYITQKENIEASSYYPKKKKNLVDMFLQKTNIARIKNETP